MDKNEMRREANSLAPEWHGWGSPVGLGLGLVAIGAFFWLLALGLQVMSSI